MTYLGLFLAGLGLGGVIGYLIGLHDVFRTLERGRMPREWIARWHEKAGR